MNRRCVMPTEVRVSSLPEAPVQPRWLRRLLIAALAGQGIAIVLMFCGAAFGWERRSVWYPLPILVLLLFFTVGQLINLRWMRQRNRER